MTMRCCVQICATKIGGIYKPEALAEKNETGKLVHLPLRLWGRVGTKNTNFGNNKIVTATADLCVLFPPLRYVYI
jgi:hypothetical protein